MRKNVFGKRFSRDTKERQALFKGLLYSLIQHGRIETTEAKSKAIKGLVDKTVTAAKKNTRATQAILTQSLSKVSAQKLTLEIAPRFTRTSGFTRTTRIGRRFSDSAELVVMEWVAFDKEAPVISKKKVVKPAIKAPKSIKKVTPKVKKTVTKKQEKKK